MSVDISRVDFNTGLFLKELESRGVSLDFLADTDVVLADYKGHKEVLHDVFSSVYSFPIGWITGDKVFTKKILQNAGVMVAEGRHFTRWQRKEAIEFAAEIDYPVVLKPTAAGQGDYVYSKIEDKDELVDKMSLLIEGFVGGGYFLIEKYIEGKEYRVFYTKNDFLAVVHRSPACVIGDGKQAIVSLIQEENYRRMNPRVNCLCEIRMDDVMFDHLAKNKISITDVPKKGEKVQLRLSSNVSKGGNCYEITDKAHESVVGLAKKVMSSFGEISYVGMDLICEDISKDIDKQKHVVCELNPSPGLSLHMMPEKGAPRDVAGALVDLLYPETEK